MSKSWIVAIEEVRVRDDGLFLFVLNILSGQTKIGKAVLSMHFSKDDAVAHADASRKMDSIVSALRIDPLNCEGRIDGIPFLLFPYHVNLGSDDGYLDVSVWDCGPIKSPKNRKE